MNDYTLENFISYCDDMEIAEEGLQLKLDNAILRLERNLRNVIIKIKDKIRKTKDSKFKSAALKILSEFQRLLSSCNHLAKEDAGEYDKLFGEYVEEMEEWGELVNNEDNVF